MQRCSLEPTNSCHKEKRYGLSNTSEASSYNNLICIDRFINFAIFVLFLFNNYHIITSIFLQFAKLPLFSLTHSLFPSRALFKGDWTLSSSESVCVCVSLSLHLSFSLSHFFFNYSLSSSLSVH